MQDSRTTNRDDPGRRSQKIHSGVGRRFVRSLQWIPEDSKMHSFAPPSNAKPGPTCRDIVLALFHFCIVAIVACLPLQVIAQTGLATLSGTVTDPTGALLPKAEVTVTNEDTGVTVKGETTRAGVYDIEALKPGRYRVIVEHQ